MAKRTDIPEPDIRKIVEYLYHDEALHYEGDEDPNHIFLSVKRVAEWLGDGDYCSKDEDRFSDCASG